MAEQLIKAKFKTTADIPVPAKLADQVIGQEKAVEIVRKAASQKRNLLLIGEPGSGKSMIAQAMAELLPVEKLEDILIASNPADRNNPRVLVAPAGQGRSVIEQERKRATERAALAELRPDTNVIMLVALLFALSIGVAIYLKLFSDIILAAFIIVGAMFMGIMLFTYSFAGGLKNLRMGGAESEEVPKVLIDSTGKKTAPFIEATGARAGSLLGDVRHDPYQSGGLGTPPHMRVEAGMIHRANRGILFVDEVSSLGPKSQQELLTAMQEKKYSITGQSEMSSGAMVRTEPVPCDFVLVAAGNTLDLEKMHPALRSRIRGYGYEVYLNDAMEDTLENRDKLARFVAQEVKKDGKVPAFAREAVEEVILEARRRAGRKNKLTMRLRDLGGLVRAAGDLANSEKSPVVGRDHVIRAKLVARTLEQQMADKQIEMKKEYEVFQTGGYAVGKVNGLAVMGDGGILLPIEAVVTPALSVKEGRLIATGKLGEIAREAVQNVSAIIKKYKGTDISNYDIHVQFLQTYEGVEGDSASVSVATAVVSAMEGIPVNLGVAMTGSISIRGEVLPVGGVTQKAEAAIEAGAKILIVPESNKDDIFLSPDMRKKIEIRTAKDLTDVLEHALKDSKEKDKLIAAIRKTINK